MTKPTTYISASGIERDVATGLPTGTPSAKAALLQRQAARLVEREVHCCLSSMVSTLAQGAGTVDRRPQVYGGGGLVESAARNLALLTEQAVELASPIPDYEEAAREAGWRIDPGAGGFRNITLAGGVDDEDDAIPTVTPDDPDAWARLCEEYGIDPYDRDVFEHWAVSSWLADKLEAKGEKVDRDFAGLIAWARTTTGQAISIDSVIEAITKETGYASGAGA